MKRFFLLTTITLIVIALSPLVTLPTSAAMTDTTTTTYTGSTYQTNTPANLGSGNASGSTTPNANLLANRMTRLKNRADQEINNRVTSLQNLINRINNMKRLTASQKSTFTSQVQATIDNLNALKAKIDADTDFATLKTDVSSIILSYRIYAFYMPQLNIVVMSDKTLEIASEMSTYSGKLQSRITADKNKGKDVTSLQSLLTDMQAKIADAQTQAQNAQNTVLPLTAAGYPGNQTILLSARGMLQTARKDLQLAWQDAQMIRQGLRSIESTNSTGPNTPPVPLPSASTGATPATVH